MGIYDEPSDPFASPSPPPVRRLDDAEVPFEALDEQVPLGSRWPDWRWLLRTDVYVPPNLVLRLDELDADGLVAVLAAVYEQADLLHTQAAEDEERAVSSALAWTFKQLKVPHVRACTALQWLHSTPLLRCVRLRLSSLS